MLRPTAPMSLQEAARQEARRRYTHDNRNNTEWWWEAFEAGAAWAEQEAAAMNEARDELMRRLVYAVSGAWSELETMLVADREGEELARHHKAKLEDTYFAYFYPENVGGPAPG